MERTLERHFLGAFGRSSVQPLSGTETLSNLHEQRLKKSLLGYCEICDTKASIQVKMCRRDVRAKAEPARGLKAGRTRKAAKI